MIIVFIKATFKILKELASFKSKKYITFMKLSKLKSNFVLHLLKTLAYSVFFMITK